jgi:type IV pilus assembly protein PilP
MRTRPLLLALGLLLAGCSDAPKEEPSKKPAAPAAPKPAAAPTAAPAAPAAAPAARGSVLEEARKRTLTKEDFTESDSNRDPFRSFLSSFAVQVVVNKQHTIILEKFALDELRLAGIVTGELQPRAMFIDPSGQGVTVVRGDHLSKVDALVTRIAADRVYLRIEEDSGTDKPRVTERQIELHAGELTAQ